MSGPKQDHVKNPNIIILNGDTLSRLGQILWDLRSMQDIKQKEAANRMGVLQCHVSSLENADPDKLKIPKVPTLVNYANSIGYDVMLVKRGTLKVHPAPLVPVKKMPGTRRQRGFPSTFRW